MYWSPKRSFFLWIFPGVMKPKSIFFKGFFLVWWSSKIFLWILPGVKKVPKSSLDFSWSEEAEIQFFRDFSWSSEAQQDFPWIFPGVMKPRWIVHGFIPLWRIPKPFFYGFVPAMVKPKPIFYGFCLVSILKNPKFWELRAIPRGFGGNFALGAALSTFLGTNISGFSKIFLLVAEGGS